MDWANIIMSLFELVIIPLLGLFVKVLIDYVNIKKEELKSKTDNTYFNKYIEMLGETVTDCVTATNQTYVESLKKQGKFDADAQKKAFEETYAAVFKILTDDAKEYLGNIYTDLPAFVTTLIEAEVNRQK